MKKTFYLSNCSHCGQQSVLINFCSNCGTKNGDTTKDYVPVKCTACKQHIPIVAKYCPHCGKRTNRQ